MRVRSVVEDWEVDPTVLWHVPRCVLLSVERRRVLLGLRWPVRRPRFGLAAAPAAPSAVRVRRRRRVTRLLVLVLPSIRWSTSVHRRATTRSGAVVRWRPAHRRRLILRVLLVRVPSSSADSKRRTLSLL